MSGNFGTYGLMPAQQTGLGGGKIAPLGAGTSLFSLGANQDQTAMSMAGDAAASEARRNEQNQQAYTAARAGNSQLGSALGGAAAGAAFGPWGALAGGAIGAIAGYNAG